MSKLRLLLLLLPLFALYAAMEAYSWTSRAALARELDVSLGPWGSWLLPWLDRLSPDITQGIGAFLHARDHWGWPWPAALAYGFPGALLAVPMLVLGIGWLIVDLVRDWTGGKKPEAGADAGTGDEAGIEQTATMQDEPEQERRQD